MEQQEILKLNEILNDNAKSLVGTLTKRLENLNLPNPQTLSFDQIKSIYFNILKNTIYENRRYLTKLIQANLEKGTIIFRQPTL